MYADTGDDAGTFSIRLVVGALAYGLTEGTDVNGVIEMLHSLTYETYATTQDDTPSGGRGRVRGWYMALKGKLPYDPTNRVK